MKFVYDFNEGNGKMRELLGGKGANLAEMTSLGMGSPLYGYNRSLYQVLWRSRHRPEIEAEIMEHLKHLEEISGKAGVNNPLLVSVRSVRASMPV